MLVVDRGVVPTVNVNEILGSLVGFALSTFLWRWVASGTRTEARRRRRPLEHAGRSSGLVPMADGERTVRALPFAVFLRGDHHIVANPLSGTRNGRPVVVADFAYASESQKPMRPRKRMLRLSIALVGIDGNLPHVRIEQQTLELQGRDLVRDDAVTFESGEFNRRFAVRSADRRFAYALVDARMMAWLLDEGDACGFEVCGPWVLAYGPRVAPDDVAGMLDRAVDFVAHVPRMVWAEQGRPS